MVWDLTAWTTTVAKADARRQGEGGAVQVEGTDTSPRRGDTTP
jgi:hypothetical protein